LPNCPFFGFAAQSDDPKGFAFSSPYYVNMSGCGCRSSEAQALIDYLDPQGKNCCDF
jgi:hypothetical protein